VHRSDSAGNPANGITRRRIVATGRRLVYAAPLVAATMRFGTGGARAAQECHTEWVCPAGTVMNPHGTCCPTGYSYNPGQDRCQHGRSRVAPSAKIAQQVCAEVADPLVSGH
jgi:hypothetical protein